MRGEKWKEAVGYKAKKGRLKGDQPTEGLCMTCAHSVENVKCTSPAVLDAAGRKNQGVTITRWGGCRFHHPATPA